MKILFLTPQLPYPPHKGTTLRNFGLIRALSIRHDVAALSLGDPGDTGNIAILAETCRVLGVIPPWPRGRLDRLLDIARTRQPDLARRLRSTRFEAALRQALSEESFDVVQIEGLEMVPHWLAAKRWGGWTRRPIAVLDAHNVEYKLQQTAAKIDLKVKRYPSGVYSLMQAARLKRYERQVADEVDGVLTVSPEEQEAFRELGVRVPIEVVPNCLDISRLPFQPSPSERNPAEIVFTGTMDYRPNVDAVTWFCHDVWPRVLSRLPEAKFTIVGRDPSSSVCQLGQIHGVTVTGAVPDVGPYLRRATIYVVPMRMGGGVRFKVLEALAAGLPVVSTTMGATGVDVTPGVHALLADQPDELASTIVRLIQRAEERALMAKAGRDLVAERFDWAVVVPRLEAFYEHLLEHPALDLQPPGTGDYRASGTA